MNVAAIETGTMLARRQRVNGFEVSEVVFAPDRRLFWHSHPHTCLAVVTKGAVRKRFSKLEEDAVDGTVIEMPAEERHEDLFGATAHGSSSSSRRANPASCDASATGTRRCSRIA